MDGSIGVAEDKQISVGLALEEVHTRQVSRRVRPKDSNG